MHVLDVHCIFVIVLILQRYLLSCSIVYLYVVLYVFTTIVDKCCQSSISKHVHKCVQASFVSKYTFWHKIVIYFFFLVNFSVCPVMQSINPLYFDGL